MLGEWALVQTSIAVWLGTLSCGFYEWLPLCQFIVWRGGAQGDLNADLIGAPKLRGV